MKTCPTRRGLTLYEVMLAMFIFLGALAAVGQVLAVGSRAAQQGRLRTEAVLRCESKLAEVLSGIEPLQAVGEASFEDGSQDWRWSLDVAPGAHPDLLDIELTVTHTGSNGVTDVSYSLRRFVRDPQILLDAALDQPLLQ